MEKIILVDGNNLLFRSYYATAYNGNFMKNSKGFPTNALFGFANMINKIINEEKPVHMIVAFDKGKTFRHDKYDTYKAGRIEMPDELKLQFPKAKEMLEYMGITAYECDNYEADDIIGTFAKYCDIEEKYIGTIISSDKDLLQLISPDVEIKLLKTKDYIRYNLESFKEEWKIDPIRIIDLKSLMGDSSDNIPGVKGVGEKTALKLIQEYGSLDNVYNNIDNIKGALKEKLITDKENAYMSYDLATICKDVPMTIDINDISYLGPDTEKLNNFYSELEFYSFIKKNEKVVKPIEEIKVKIIKNLDEIEVNDDCAIYLEILGTNYHTAKVLGMAVYNQKISYFIPFDILKENPLFLKSIKKSTYDLKKTYVSLKWHEIEIDNMVDDLMIQGYLLEYNIKDDIAYLANNFDYEIPFYENIYGKNKLIEPPIEEIANHAIKKARFIFDMIGDFNNKLEVEKQIDLYRDIELKLATVLGDMEYNGINVDVSILEEMGQEIKIKMELTSNDIYNYAGTEFNISSPSQLGEILFEKLNLPHGKKGKTGYSTAADVLIKIRDKHPIIDLISEYRMLSKLYSTYIEGLKNSIMEDGKIHTIYTQTLTRTGRLSSIEPNLQNIPIRYEEGRKIRKAFVPSANSTILSSDYSQIELRILASMASVDSLIDAFRNDLDIHTKTASDIFHIDQNDVTKNMRRIAKAVNFGIVYGISPYGLSENLQISPYEAKEYIDGYFTTYPGIKEYMDNTIKEAYETLSVKTLFNRKRVIPELSNKNYMIRQQGERIALNTPIQGTAADIIKKAMININEYMKKEKIESKMILQVHDELIFDCLDSEKEKMVKMIKDVMENVFELSVPLKVEIETGDNWYQAK